VNVSNSKMQSDFASVKEQSGIKAGDGGFQLTVGGNTNLVGAVITSTDAAVAAGKNALSTATLTQSDLQNKANYAAQSVSLGGGYSTGGAGVGKDQQGNAVTGGAQTPGSTLPSLNGFSATTPVAMAASGNASSVTRSGISGGAVTITDSTAQLALTGKTSTQAIADVKRDVATGKDGSNALAPIFNKQEIEAGFTVVSALTREVGTFLETRAKEVDVKKAAADKAEQAAQDPNSGLSDAARLALIDQAIALRGEAQTISADWGAGGTYRQITTALVAAAGGNVTGSSGAMVQGMVVNYVQQQGAGYIGQLVANGTLIEGSAEHAALHAIVACGGAAAGGSNCASGAGGAAVSSLLTGLFSETSPDESQAQREAKRNLITSLVGGIAATTGADVATATGAGIAATDNNWLASQQVVQRNKELAAAKGPLETMAVMAKWAGVSGKQDALTLNGVAKGLAEAGWTDVKGLATFLANPEEGLNGLKVLLSSSDARARLGDSVVNSLKGKIDRMNFALVHGGDQNAEKLGKEIGEVIWQVGSVLTGAGAIAKGGIALAKAGINVGSSTLKAMAATSTAVITEIKIASALPGAAKSVEALSAQTGAGLKSQYAAKPGSAYTVKARAGSAKSVASLEAALEPVTGANAISESTINPALAARLVLYQKWGADNGVVGTPSLKEFQLFDDSSRVESGFKTYANSEWPPHSGALDGNNPFTLLPGAQLIDLDLILEATYLQLEQRMRNVH
jgi:filamentous hemagglutinin